MAVPDVAAEQAKKIAEEANKKQEAKQKELESKRVIDTANLITPIAQEDRPDIIKQVTDKKITPPDRLNPEQPKYKSMADIVEQQRLAAQPTADEIKRQERKARIYKTLATLNDTVSAFGGMVAAKNGAVPNTPPNTASEYSKKYAEMLAERRANNKYWQDATVRAEMQDRASALQERLAAEKAKADAALQKSKHANDMELLGVKNEAVADRQTESLAFKKWLAENVTLPLGKRRGVKNITSKSSRTPEFLAFDDKGNPTLFFNAKAAENYAKANGTWVPDTVEVENEKLDTYGRKQTVKSTRVIGGHPANPNKKSFENTSKLDL